MLIEQDSTSLFISVKILSSLYIVECFIMPESPSTANSGNDNLFNHQLVCFSVI